MEYLLGEIIGVTSVIAVVVDIVIFVVSVIAGWKIFCKFGEPGWKALVPFYNLYLAFRYVWGNGLLFLLLLIPFVNLVIMIIFMVKLSHAFGLGGWFAVGLIFLPFIFSLILAFGNAVYMGIPNKGGYQVYHSANGGTYPPSGGVYPPSGGVYPPSGEAPYRPTGPDPASASASAPHPTFCTNCGQQIKSGEKFCPNCGQQIVESRICPRCGHRVNANQRYCPHCDAELR